MTHGGETGFPILVVLSVVVVVVVVVVVIIVVPANRFIVLSFDLFEDVGVDRYRL